MGGLLFDFYDAVKGNKYPSFYGISEDENDAASMRAMAEAVIDEAIKASSIGALRPEIMSTIIDKFYSYVDIKSLACELAHALTMWDSDTCLDRAPSVIRDNVCANRVLSFNDDVAFAIDDMAPKDFGILLNLISQGAIVCEDEKYAHRILSYAQRRGNPGVTSMLTMMDLCIN